jgi:hypothetical protein
LVPDEGFAIQVNTGGGFRGTTEGGKSSQSGISAPPIQRSNPIPGFGAHSPAHFKNREASVNSGVQPLGRGVAANIIHALRFHQILLANIPKPVHNPRVFSPRVWAFKD